MRTCIEFVLNPSVDRFLGAFGGRQEPRSGELALDALQQRLDDDQKMGLSLPLGLRSVEPVGKCNWTSGEKNFVE